MLVVDVILFGDQSLQSDTASDEEAESEAE